jgi:hypothetical protein
LVAIGLRVVPPEVLLQLQPQTINTSVKVMVFIGRDSVYSNKNIITKFGLLCYLPVYLSTVMCIFAV